MRPVRVLVYHEVTEETTADKNSTSLSFLEKHVQFLAKKGYRLCSVKELLQQDEEKKIGLTFDDGYESFYERAFPLLVDYGFTATVFAITDCLFGLKRMPYKTMSPGQLVEVAQSGFEVGCHSKSHCDLTRVGPKQLEGELSTSRAALGDAFGVTISGFAYPYGAANDEVTTAVERSGYDYACASSVVPLSRLLRTSRYLIPRIDVSRWNPAVAHSLIMAHRILVYGESIRNHSFALRHWR